jgi:HEAT repeat protein
MIASRVFRCTFLAAGLLSVLTYSVHAYDEVIDTPMYDIPHLAVPRFIGRFPHKAKDLWLRALERPEAEMRAKAAQAIATAHERGIKGFEDTIPALLTALDRPDQHPTVRLEAARALIVLDAKQAAPSLFKHAQAGGTVLRDQIEPALAKWDYQPMREVWLERLRNAGTPQRSLTLAIRGLMVVREKKSWGRLQELALSDVIPGPVRLEAARALAEMRHAGLEIAARQLVGDVSPRDMVARLVAVSLLRRHKSKEAIQLLEHLGDDPEPSVAVAALTRLFELNPDFLVPKVKRILANADPNVRLVGVRVLFQRPGEEPIHLLRETLDDPHPDVRVLARKSLKELAGKQEFRARIIEEATAALGRTRWRALEQSAILLTQLDHKPAVTRLLELLRFHRPEVFITAAWGLRKLAVPETLPAVLSFVDTESSRYLGNAQPPEGVTPDLIDHQISQLNQFLGLQRYKKADPVMRRFIPKILGKPISGEARAAAIWALGMMHEGNTGTGLVRALEDRLKDTTTIPPEDNRVRWACAITLGRIRGEEALPSLRRYCPDYRRELDPVNNACGWAIGQITRQPGPPDRTIETMQRNWFLTPTD